MTLSEPLPTCRRKAIWAFAVGVLFLLFAWAGRAWLHLPDGMVGAIAGMGSGGFFAAVLLWFSPDTSDAVPKKLMRRYIREISWAMAAYVVSTLVWKRVLDMADATWLRVLIALFPALMVCFVLRAFVRYVRDCDEMQRRIELESGAIAGLLVSAVYLAAGFLQTAELISVPAKVAMIWVFPLLCVMYGITKVFVSRHYV
jgi:hypothetical protein